MVEIFVKVLEKRLGTSLTATINPEEMVKRLNRARDEVLREDGLGPVAPRMLDLMEKLLREDKATPARISQVIERQPSLVPEIISAANSALYPKDSRVSKLSEALVRVGLNEARNIIVTLLYRPLFEQTGPEFRSLLHGWWKQSLLTGLVCQGLAAKRAQEQLPTAFLLGLLHTIGKPCLLKAFNDDWPGGDLGPAHSQALTEFIDNNHRKAGESVLSGAGFQESFLRAVRSYGLSNPGGLAPESLLLNAAADVTAVIRSGEELKAADFHNLISVALLGLTSQDVEGVVQKTVPGWDLMGRVFPGPGAGSDQPEKK